MNNDDIYEKTKKRYIVRKACAITAMTAGLLAFVLTVVFIFIDLGGQVPNWNQFHFWAAGFGAVLISSGAVLFVSSISALKDIEKTVNRQNPDEREQAILNSAKCKTFKLYTTIIFPIIFAISSVLLMCKQINFVAWIIFIANILITIITYAIIRAMEYKKF